MGWWSTDVLGGDHPLDVLAGMEDVLGLGELYPFSSIRSPGLVRARLEHRLDEALTLVGTPGTPEYDPIGWQVLGALAVSIGAELPADVTQHVLAAIDGDAWAVRDPGRAEAMAELYQAVRDLPVGGPAPVATTTLRTALDQMTLSGQTGMVNLPGPDDL